MAKPTLKKETKTAAPVVAPKKGTPKLVKKTAAQLHDLIGDTPIGVSLKELVAITTKAAKAEATAKLLA